MKSCLIIPCYNEEKRLQIDAFRDFVDNQTQVDLLFVNDGSRDRTSEVLKKIEGPRVQILSLEKNGGKAEAVRQGVLTLLAENRYGKIGFWDADLSTPLMESLRMVDHLTILPDMQMVFGCRLMRLGARVERLWIRHLFGRAFATVVSNMLDVKVYDTQCGAKMFRAETAELVFKEPFVSRWFFDVEILWRFLLAGRSLQNVYEMPVHEWIHRSGSKLTPMNFITAYWDLLMIGRHYRRKRSNALAQNPVLISEPHNQRPNDQKDVLHLRMLEVGLGQPPQPEGNLRPQTPQRQPLVEGLTRPDLSVNANVQNKEAKKND